MGQLIDTQPETTLTAFFNLNQEDAFARTLLYNQMPACCTWDTRARKFVRRKRGESVQGQQGVKKSRCTWSCLHSASEAGRMLLPPSSPAQRSRSHIIHFDAIKTIDGHVCATHRQACQRLGLLHDGGHRHLTMNEACASHLPASIRCLFAMIVSFCEVSDP